MWISSVTIDNVRGFKHTELSLSKGINVLVGQNNSGKSTILKAISLVQPFDGQANHHKGFEGLYQRLRAKDFSICIAFENVEPRLLANVHLAATTPSGGQLIARFTPRPPHAPEGSPLPVGLQATPGGTLSHSGWLFNLREPHNLLFPFFTRRKPLEFAVHVGDRATNSVEESLKYIYAKIDRVALPKFPEYNEFKRLCERIFDFEISSYAAYDGKESGLSISRTENIPISAMGEGTVNLLGFISQILLAEGKVFLIEELENDIHPKALKALLELIISKATTNQFIISTHSNIVAKYAGSLPDAKLFSLSMKLENSIPTSTVVEVPNTPESRIKVLEDLGYDIFDFELWKAYLILEESSAQSVIEQTLIPLFAPTLASSLKIIAASGNMDVEARFSDFLRLFVFVHTSSPYKDRAWVAVDGDSSGKEVVQSLQKKFTSWPASHFRAFSEAAFEMYYPAEFQGRVSAVLAMPKSDAKRDEKKKLALDVIAWAKANEGIAKTELAKSAKEIIVFLQEIEKQLQ